MQQLSRLSMNATIVWHTKVCIDPYCTVLYIQLWTVCLLYLEEVCTVLLNFMCTVLYLYLISYLEMMNLALIRTVLYCRLTLKCVSTVLWISKHCTNELYVHCTVLIFDKLFRNEKVSIDPYCTVDWLWTVCPLYLGEVCCHLPKKVATPFVD